MGTISKLKTGKKWIKQYVKKQAMTPCKNFPIIYGFIEISDFDMILKTCNNTLNPPKPSSNEQIIILVEIFFVTILQTIFKPFVNSIIPDKTGVI